MALVINTNTQSLFAQRALSNNTGALTKRVERLSTGFRINRAGDDAAGLSISEKMTAEIRGLNQARRNAADGISLLQTAEGGLSIIHENLQRIRELYVQGINDSNGALEKDALQREINARVKTIDEIARATKFNGRELLVDPPFPLPPRNPTVVLQTGANNGEQTIITLVPVPPTANQGITVDIAAVSGLGQMSEGVGLGVTLNKFGLAAAGMTVKAQDNLALGVGNLGDIDTMVNNISRMRSELGAVQNSLESKITYLSVAAENVSASRSTIKDTDVALESSELIKTQILQQTAAAMLAQVNQGPAIANTLIPR